MKKILVLWIIVSVAILILTVMHPRPNNLLVLLLCIIKCITLLLSKKEIESKVVWKKNIKLMIVFAVIWYMGKYLNILYPYHASYEYRNDIANYKTGSIREYYAEFPDAIPDEAKGIKWICCPGFMQGSGYDVLFFRADSSYLKKIYEEYATLTNVYTYSNYGWENKKAGRTVTFPQIIDMTEQEKTNVTVIVTYDNGDINHLHSSGLYINQIEGYVCFYRQ